jgi:CAAX protease family protein
MSKENKRRPSSLGPIKLARQVGGFVAVASAMTFMFLLPRKYFAEGSIVATTVMIVVSVLVLSRGYMKLYRPNPKTISIGIGSALLLYLIFFGGNILVKTAAPLGVSASNEASIYSLFASTPITLRVIVFVLDAVGFESYFRGTLQPVLTAKMGISAAFLVALIDAAIHVSSLNPLFVITTFIADSVWGLNFFLTKDLTSNVTSHLLWDLLIFIVFPIS